MSSVFEVPDVSSQSGFCPSLLVVYFILSEEFAFDKGACP